MLTMQEKNIIKTFFNHGGYVFDFSNSTFDSFTIQSVGVAIHSTYGLSKAKSLASFIDNESDYNVLKLTKDLLDYYDDLNPEAIWKTYENDNTADKIRDILISNDISEVHVFSEINDLTLLFNTEYMEKQITLMRDLIETHPADSIGKSKELLESCFKFILDSEKIKYKESSKLQELRKQVFVLLNLEANNNETAKSDQEVRKILSSLTQVVDGINNLRNRDGDGHGKGKQFIELPPRYARLVVNSSVALVRFIWDTYNEIRK